MNELEALTDVIQWAWKVHDADTQGAVSEESTWPGFKSKLFVLLDSFLHWCLAPEAFG